MGRDEKEVLNGIVHVLENLTVKIDAVEGALVRTGLLPDRLCGQLEPEYRAAAMRDLAALRAALSALPITRNALG